MFSQRVTIDIGSTPTRTDAGFDRNALQQLIYDFKRDNPGETYASTPRHIVPRQLVYSAATTERLQQTPHRKTIEALARGMNMTAEDVAAAAAYAASYFRNTSETDGPRAR